MTDLNVQIPDSLYKQISDLAARENLSISQLVAIALSAQFSAWMTKDYLEKKPSEAPGKSFSKF